MPSYRELVAVPVGFFDDDSALFEDQVEAGESGGEVVALVGAEGAGRIRGLCGDVAVAKELDGEVIERCFVRGPEGAEKFVTGRGVVNA